MEYIVRQLWNEFEKTGNRRLLAEALAHVDFSDPFGDNANVRKKIQDILMGVKGQKKSGRNNKKRATAKSRTASALFSSYKARGMDDDRAIEFVAIALAITQTEVVKMLQTNVTEIKPTLTD